MRRPSEYVVEYDGGDEDTTVLMQVEVGDDRNAAIQRARELSEQYQVTVLVQRRVGIEDVTPEEDPPGLIWDWADLELVEEVTS